MRCYEITHKIVDGLPLVCPEGANPYVLLAGRGGVVNDRSGRFPLSSELAAKVSAATNDGLLAVSRLMRCDIERRNELWLTPECEKSQAALVLFPSHYMNQNGHGTLGFVSEGAVERLEECDFTRAFEQYPSNDREVVQRSGRSVLVQLLPETAITAVEIFETSFWKKGAQNRSVELATVRMHANGRLDLKFHKERAEYIFKIAAGAPQARFDESD